MLESHSIAENKMCYPWEQRDLKGKKKIKIEGITSHPLLEMVLVLGLRAQVLVEGGLLGWLL